MAGNETIILSFNFILTKSPSNISVAKPPDEIINIQRQSKPGYLKDENQFRCQCQEQTPWDSRLVLFHSLSLQIMYFSVALG